MVQFGGPDSASVGIKLPNGTYERPIGKSRLFWVRPGKGFSQINAWMEIKTCLAVGHAQVKKEQWFLYYFCVIHKTRFWCIYLSAIYHLFIYLTTVLSNGTAINKGKTPVPVCSRKLGPVGWG